jgi:Double zinc ribbon
MECPQCQHENPPQAKFCLDCGAPWPGSARPAALNFPPDPSSATSAGRPWRPLLLEGRALPPPSPTPRSTSPRRFSPPKSALECERKQVTVLLVDVSRFHRPVRAPGSRRGPRSDEAGVRAHARRGTSVRGHGEPVSRRRDHGTLRCSHRPRGARAPCPARRGRRTTNVAARFLQAPNPGGGPRISTADSPASVWMLQTNEEMMIASHTLACIRP